MKLKQHKLLAYIFAVILGLGLVVGAVNSQVISGDLLGTILDKSGAAVPNATVTATNVGTAAKHETTANGQGEYRFNNLPVGTYNISATAPGFATTNVSSARVELNKTSTLHITLELSTTTTSIEVVGGATTLDTTTAQLSSTFESKAAENLPSSRYERCAESIPLDVRRGFKRRRWGRVRTGSRRSASPQQQLYRGRCGQQRQERHRTTSDCA